MEKILEKFNLTSKKGIENLVILLVLVVIVMVVINSLFTEKEEVPQIEQVVKQEVNSDSLEKKLENILTSIKGVGKVKVMISYTNSIEKVPIYDTKEVTTLTNELDSSGGKRETKETKYCLLVRAYCTSRYRVRKQRNNNFVNFSSAK